MSISALGGCIVDQLPPTHRPAQQLPTVPVDVPASPGQGQVVFDVEQGSAQVEAITAQQVWSGTYVHGSATETVPICVTPCVANMPFGPHKMRFRLLHDSHFNGDEMITVGSQRSIVRYNPGRNHVRVGGLVGGLTLVTLGGVTGIVGLAMSATESGRSTGSELLISGVTATLVGMILWRHTIVQQQGALQQWVAP
jgi:hypothetical protein